MALWLLNYSRCIAPDFRVSCSIKPQRFYRRSLRAQSCRFRERLCTAISEHARGLRRSLSPNNFTEGRRGRGDFEQMPLRSPRPSVKTGLDCFGCGSAALCLRGSIPTAELRLGRYCAPGTATNLESCPEISAQSSRGAIFRSRERLIQTTSVGDPGAVKRRPQMGSNASEESE